MSQDSRVAVIGSGSGDSLPPCVAAARGHRVTVYDKNSWLGGKAAVLHEGGFRFDMGPTILTVPRVLERIFAEAGRSVHDYMDLRRLDPQWRCFFDDNTRIDLMQDVATMATEMDRFAPGTGEGYKKFISISEHLHGVSEKFFFWKPVEDLFDTINIRENMNPAHCGMFSPCGCTPRWPLPSGARSRTRGWRRCSTTSSSMSARRPTAHPPCCAPSPTCRPRRGLVPDGRHPGRGRGPCQARGRTRRDAEARRRGDGNRHRHGAVRGVRTTAGTDAYDAVISNMDSVRTYKELIGGEPGKSFEKKNPEPACSGVVLYLGLKERYEHLAHHDFVFSRDPEEEFEYIYRKGEPAPDPTAYLAAPSSTDPSVAPEGGEALYVLVHTPYLRPHHDWRPDGPLFQNYRRTILDKLKRTAGLSDIEDRIVVERHLTPQDIHERYKVLNGAIYGLASHGKVMGAFKPGNRSRQVRGLYLAGGAAHPGPGMPMVMMSGWIAADALDSDARGQGLGQERKSA